MDCLTESTTDRISITGGITLTGKICELIRFVAPSSPVPYPGILRSLAGILSQGRAHFEEIYLFRNNQLFQASFELIFVPAPKRPQIIFRMNGAGPGFDEAEHAAESLHRLSYRQDFL